MWALDLGTTNTLLARWDQQQERPSVLELPAMARLQQRDRPLDAPRTIPTAVHLIEFPSTLARLGQWGPLARNFSLGKLAQIGRPAVELNQVRPRQNYVSTFKQALSRSPLVTIARAGGRSYCARDVGRIFLRELLAEAETNTGERIRDLVVTVPVEAFETYRAELASIGQSLGIRRMRFIDEPVAAALGYGLGLSRQRCVLVVDFGGGTFHLALVRLSNHQIQAGKAVVLAKAGRSLGGSTVDRWILEELCQRLDYAPDETDVVESSLWYRMMLTEACRLKEAVYFQDLATFSLLPTEDLRRFEERVRARASMLQFGRDDLVRLLTERGLYRSMEECLADVLCQCESQGISESDIEEVLMVGGSTLLPEVYALFERRFGRDRVRAWQPFEAVAYGAAVFAAGRTEPADFIAHDYALLTYDLQTKKPTHSIIVPRGTRFPTTPEFWRRQLVPTCPLGEPESVFKLIICELGGNEEGQRFAWDDHGRLHKLGDQTAPDKSPLVIKLNEADPVLGTLAPPHSPSDQSPRLEVSFGVNAERWLCAKVQDLRSGKLLLRDEPVVRLL